MANKRSRADETAELVDALYTLMPLVVGHVDECLRALDMTHTDLWALRSIDGPMPMKELAVCMDFDPSYVTIVADRLEELGLVERQPHPTDRRIKNLVLTAKGRRVKKTIPVTVWSDPNMFSDLTDSERAQFLGLVTKLVASTGRHEPSA